MNRPTIVIVDDDKHTVELLQDYLQGQGYVVYTGSDGHMALPLAKTRKPALVILDVDMPIMNGLKALKELRNEPTTRHIPVIMLTGVASGQVFPAVANLPKVSHLKKPISLEDLASMVRHYIPNSE